MTRRALYSYDTLAALPTIANPTLVLFGDQDALQKNTDRLKVLPDVRFATIANAGHVTMLDQPAEFARVVLDFLSS